MSHLLIGCGTNKLKKVHGGPINPAWEGLVTLDMDASVNPDVVWDLETIPYPFEDNQFSEVHAYEVLEHLGRQGDWRFFFKQFGELYRIIKPGGYLVGTVPQWDSPWAWGDPGHKRVLTRGSFIFLDREEYEQIGNTAMTDYRPWLECDFRLVGHSNKSEMFGFILQARK